MSDPDNRLVDLTDVIEAERQAEQEISKRGRDLLKRSPDYPLVKVNWVCVEDTQGTLYIFKENALGPGVDGQELIYAEDLQTGRCVGRGDVMMMVEAIEILRQHMILDDLADI